MKRILTLLVILAVTALSGNAGGLVTNTNQSARFTRLAALDALYCIDAVYYNPAGLTMLGDGFHFSLNNQFIGQTKTISSTHPYLLESPMDYEGNISANLFPGVYAAYRTGRVALSFGMNPIGGGGGATYEKGLPSLEYQLAGIIPMLEGTFAMINPLITQIPGVQPVTFTGYEMDMFFEGTSAYMGYQGNFSIRAADWLSVAVGARYVTAKNTTKGHVKDFKVFVPNYGGMQAPGDLLRGIALIPGVPGAIGGLMNAYADTLDMQTNVEVEFEETGSGYTPVASVCFFPTEGLSIAFKYEHSTELLLTRTIIDGKDGNGMYEDGAEIVADMPAMLAAGAAYKFNDKFLLSAGTHIYFDKNNDYDGSLDEDIEMIDKNFLEIALGAEYKATEELTVSGGVLVAQTGVNAMYQGDSRYSLSSKSAAFGVGYKINPLMMVNLGISYTMYDEYTKDFNDPVSYEETYDNSTWLLGVGLNISLDKKKSEE